MLTSLPRLLICKTGAKAQKGFQCQRQGQLALADTWAEAGDGMVSCVSCLPGSLSLKPEPAWTLCAGHASQWRLRLSHYSAFSSGTQLARSGPEDEPRGKERQVGWGGPSGLEQTLLPSERWFPICERRGGLESAFPPAFVFHWKNSKVHLSFL